MLETIFWIFAVIFAFSTFRWCWAYLVWIANSFRGYDRMCGGRMPLPIPESENEWGLSKTSTYMGELGIWLWVSIVIWYGFFTSYLKSPLVFASYYLFFSMLLMFIWRCVSVVYYIFIDMRTMELLLSHDHSHALGYDHYVVKNRPAISIQIVIMGLTGFFGAAATWLIF